MNRSKITKMNDLEKKVLLSAKAEKVEMTLNTSNAMASGLLIQRLTELYENPIEATVRETVSNAIDAVTESHSGKRPEVKIVAPTSLHPVLTIRDNGVGMSYEDLKEIYSKYGSSTKTDNLETIGAYGLGAKSPLAYGTEFTVTSVRKGQKTTIIVAREELTNYIKIVNSVDTDEPSGTTVSVPVNSRDVDKFAEHINKYKKTPMDKDIDLIINGTLVKNSHTLLTTKLKIYENDKETVLGKVWIDIKEAIEILNINDYNLKNQLKFVIGGWGYDTPSGRSRYYSTQNNKIFVELKPGIVGFNSSRDAILENDRYYDFEKLVLNYVSSEQFTKDVATQINKLPIDDFKKIMSTLLHEYRRYIKFEENGLTMKEIIMGNNRKIEFEYLTHEETGFNINQILNNVPKTQLPTIVFREHKGRHSKSSKNGLMEKHLSSYNQFDISSITLINQTIDDVMNREESGHNLNNLVINIASLIHMTKKDNSEIKITFVTDIENKEEIKQLKTGRKSLVKLRNGNTESEDYSSILVYTQHTKKEIEMMLEDIKVEDLDLTIESANEIINQIKNFKSSRRVSCGKREKQVGLSTRLHIHDLKGRRNAHINDVADDINNFVLITKSNNLSTSRMNMIHSWYCNENNLTADEVAMYISYGMHTIADLKILQEKFDTELYRDPSSDSAGMSTLYFDEIHDKVAKMNAIRNDSVNTSEKAFVRLITGVYEGRPSDIMNRLSDILENLTELSKITNIPFASINKEKIDEFTNFDTKIFGDFYYSSDWALNDDTLSHIASLVNKEHLELAQNLLLLCNNRSFNMIDDELKTTYNRINDILPPIYVVSDVYTKDKGTEAYRQAIKTSVTAYMEFAQTTINQLLLLNLQ